MGKVLFTLAILTAVLYGVMASCRILSYAPDPEDGEFYCSYEGYKMRNGSSFRSPAPYCDDCFCEGKTMMCCGYGFHAGVISVTGCVHVPIEGSCEVNLRQLDDKSKPCLEHF